MYDKVINGIKSNHLYKYQKEENAELEKERYEFITFELVLPVLEAAREPRTWKEVGLLSVHEYERQLQLFADSNKWGQLLEPRGKSTGDWWIKPTRISSSIGRKRIAQLLEENGYYLARPPRLGIQLTTDPEVIAEDHLRNISGVKTRGNGLAKTAQRVNKNFDGMELRSPVIQARLIKSSTTD